MTRQPFCARVVNITMDSNLPSWFELYEQNEKLEGMIHIYQEEIVKLEEERDDLKTEILFLRKQLEYKTMGKPQFHRLKDKDG